MLAIKLQRIGKKHQPSYRIVVQEKRTKLNGLSREDLGWFNPLNNKREINKDRAMYWISVGAKPTPTVHNLLIRTGIIRGKKIAVHSQSKKVKDGAEAEVKKPV